MTPFTIAISDSDLADLETRLGETRFPDSIEGAGWEYGTEDAFLRKFVAHWRDRFDWRAAEARLNGFPQFREEIDGETLDWGRVERLFLLISGERKLDVLKAAASAPQENAISKLANDKGVRLDVYWSAK